MHLVQKKTAVKCIFYMREQVQTVVTHESHLTLSPIFYAKLRADFKDMYLIHSFRI